MPRFSLVRAGQTLGKKLCGIAIVMTGGNEVPFWKLVLVRAWFFPLLFAPLLAGPAMPLLALAPLIDQAFIFGQQRRCLHDLIAGTLVVSVRREGHS